MRISRGRSSLVAGTLSASLLAVFGLSFSVEAQTPSNLPSDVGTVEGTAKLAASAGVVDVLGVKLGMPAKDVAPLVKASNAKYQLKTAVICALAVSCDKNRSPQVAIVGADNQWDILQVGFTAPPTPGYVAAITRHVDFSNGPQPTLQTIVDSLHKKYGDDSANSKTEFRNHNKILDEGGGSFSIIWLFDTQGHLFKFQNGEPILACLRELQVPVAGQDTSWDTQYGSQPRVLPPGLCNMTRVFAKIAVQLDGAVHSMDVNVENELLWHSAALATWNMRDQAAKQQQEEQRKKAQGVAAPKL
jgi:hypothetical protein